jgi:hypothetical protein
VLVAGLTAVFFAVGAPAAWAVLAEQRVVATTLDESIPAADWSADGTAGYLAYSRNSLAAPKAYHAYLRTTRNGVTKEIRLNTRGSGWAGGVDAPLVVYQQVVGDDSNVKFYDIATRTRSNPLPGLNTFNWEWHPTISGDWILFGRRTFSAPRSDVVLLVNRLSGIGRILSSATRFGLSPGQVNGNWAVFARCITLCNVFLHNIEAETTIRLARPDPDSDDPVHQYSPAVAPDGTVYLIRGFAHCADALSIVRYGADDPSTGTVIATVPRGRYVLTTFVRAGTDGSTELFYDRLSCRNDKGDIYKVVDP